MMNISYCCVCLLIVSIHACRISLELENSVPTATKAGGATHVSTCQLNDKSEGIYW
jgi:hypothetical protein